MIAKLRGIIDSVGSNWAIIDVGGVGYLVTCSGRTLGRLVPGEPAELAVETQLREDALQLFGFWDADEREWFRLLQTVQGVGARVALAILTVLPPDQLLTALAAEDRAALQRADGVGAKLAVRVLSELRDKAGAMALGAANKAALATRTAGTPAVAALDGAQSDAVSALVNLGYGRTEAFTAVAKVARGLEETPNFDALIKGALKELAR